PAPDRAGDALGDEGSEQVHDGGEEQRRPWGQGSGGHRGRDGVGRVVEPVCVVEDESDHDDRDDKGELHRVGHDSLTAICSTVLATLSKESTAYSSCSTTSLSLRTVRASY